MFAAYLPLPDPNWPHGLGFGSEFGADASFDMRLVHFLPGKPCIADMG